MDLELIPDPELLYETEFENLSAKTVNVPENGATFLHLPAGERFKIYSIIPTTTYARFSRVVWEKDGSVSVKVNKDWKPPKFYEGRYILEIMNEAGREVEGFRIGGERIDAYRGIPRFVPVDVNDPNAFYKRILIKSVIEKVPDPDRAGYLKTETKIVTERELRSKKEIREIKERIEKAAIADAIEGVKFPREVTRVLAEE